MRICEAEKVGFGYSALIFVDALDRLQNTGRILAAILHEGKSVFKSVNRTECSLAIDAAFPLDAHRLRRLLVVPEASNFSHDIQTGARVFTLGLGVEQKDPSFKTIFATMLDSLCGTFHDSPSLGVEAWLPWLKTLIENSYKLH